MKIKFFYTDVTLQSGLNSWDFLQAKRNFIRPFFEAGDEKLSGFRSVPNLAPRAAVRVLLNPVWDVYQRRISEQTSKTNLMIKWFLVPSSSCDPVYHWTQALAPQLMLLYQVNVESFMDLLLYLCCQKYCRRWSSLWFVLPCFIRNKLYVTIWMRLPLLTISQKNTLCVSSRGALMFFRLLIQLLRDGDVCSSWPRWKAVIYDFLCRKEP